MVRVVNASQAQLLAFALEVNRDVDGESFIFPSHTPTRLLRVRNGSLAGCSFQQIANERLMIHELFVLSPYRGCGLGKLMIVDAMNQALALGCHSLRLNSAPNAVGFYQRLGFTFTDSITCIYDLEKGFPT